MTKSTTYLLVFIILCLAFIQPVMAQAPQTSPDQGATTPELIELAVAAGQIDRATADLYLAYALTAPDLLPPSYYSNAPWDGTLVLAHLQQRVEGMITSRQQTQIQRQLDAICSGNSVNSPAIFESSYFYIEYDAANLESSLTIQDYAATLDETWQKEVVDFGWAAPPFVPVDPPPNNHYPVIIDNLSGGLYGFVSASGDYAGFVGNNPNTPWTETGAYASCMVLNQNYTGFPSPPLESLQATVAHEFNHSIQFGYLALFGFNSPDNAFVEGGASWIEDEVFDSSNDNYYFLWPNFEQCMGQYNASPYSYWVVFRALTEPYGTGIANGGEQIMQDFWEESSRGSSQNLTALNRALVNVGTTLPEAYHEAAIALAFNQSCGGEYETPYCLEEGTGYVSTISAPAKHGAIPTTDSSYNGSIQDNYALNWITLPTDAGRYNLVLENTAVSGQFRASAVCDTGTTLRISPFPETVDSGQSTMLTAFNSDDCVTAVAVITNQNQTDANPTFCTPRSYQLTTNSEALPYLLYFPLFLSPS